MNLFHIFVKYQYSVYFNLFRPLCLVRDNLRYDGRAIKTLSVILFAGCCGASLPAGHSAAGRFNRTGGDPYSAGGKFPRLSHAAGEGAA
jgi:hypothetical protein